MTDMKKAGIAIDPWKQATFERHLTAADYTFKNGGKIHEDAMLLMVETDDLAALKTVLEAAHDECKRTGRPQ